MSETLNNDAGWWLVLIIWGDRYEDHHCNQLIESAYTYSSTIQGVVVLSDRSDRNIDDRARVFPYLLTLTLVNTRVVDTQ